MLKKSKKEKPSKETNINPDASESKKEKVESTDESVANATDSKTDKESAKEPESAEDEATRIKNQYIRLMADFDNYRKRQAREREEIVKRSNERLLGDILPVVDHLELALTKITDPDDPFTAGVKLVFDQFQGVLKRCGLTPIEAKGEEFNPELHEALSYIPSPSVPANKVIDQFRCGWDLSGHLMRAAQVIVSSGKPDADAEQECVSD
ncbi:MAG: nucleotide exchange factor GrpE [Kiritimatiellae bacterium]|jgi:molecular chaperone GrpE|nr:nucleotide exchange factor GrpE [Kiritimatiellia bacterium]